MGTISKFKNNSAILRIKNYDANKRIIVHRKYINNQKEIEADRRVEGTSWKQNQTVELDDSASEHYQMAERSG